MGEIAIGCAEASSISVLAGLMNYFRQKYPLVHYTLYSGIADDIKERIENGLLDIAFLTEPVDISKYGFVRLPHKEEWGIFNKKRFAAGRKTGGDAAGFTGHFAVNAQARPG